MKQCKIKFSYNVEMIKMEIQCKFVLPTMRFRCIVHASTRAKIHSCYKRNFCFFFDNIVLDEKLDASNKICHRILNRQ